MQEPSDQAFDGSSDGRDSTEIARLLIDGRSSIAIRKLRGARVANPDDPFHEAELACALAFAGEPVEAERILSAMGNPPMGSLVKSRIGATRALLASRKGDLESIGTHLSEALNSDPGYPLLDLLMARFYMLVDVDLDRAEEHLRRLVVSIPGSLKATVHLAALLSENGKRTEGMKLAIQNAISHPTSLTAALAAFFASVVTLPMNGGVFLAALVILSLFPFLGPVIFVGWLTVTIAAFFSLRRIWPRIVLASTLGLVTLAIGYVARTIVWGRLFP